MSANQLIITIDCGTSSIRAIAFDAITGREMLSSRSKWSKEENSGEANFDAAENWSVICRCIKEVVEQVGRDRIAGITTTSFRHGVVCVDKNGEEIFACHNADSRPDTQVSALVRSGQAEEIFRIAGDWPTIHPLPMLMWLRENDQERFERIWKAFSVAGWVTYRLCGEAVAEPSMASSSSLYDVKKQQWSERVLEISSIPRTILPALVRSGSIVGTVEQSVSELTGLPTSTPVVVGFADTQSAMIATGDFLPDRWSVVSGTFWLQAETTEVPITDETLRMRTQCHCVEDLWFNEGCSFFLGPSFDWFAAALVDKPKDKGNDSRLVLNELTERAALVPPGAYGVQVIMSDLTDVSNYKHAAPAFLDWNILNHEESGIDVFFRALLEDAALQTYGQFRRIEEITGKWPKSLTFSGGSASNELLAQILADVLDTTVITPEHFECSALGAAIVSSTATGCHASLADAKEAMSSVGGVYSPRKEHLAIYRDKYEKWRIIYEKMLELADAGMTKHMWKAAGTTAKKP